MALGDQGKALRILSERKGWDCTRIRNPDGSYGDSVSNFDRCPEGVDHKTTGSLPAGLGDHVQNFDAATEAPLSPNAPVPWRAPKRRDS